MWRGYPQGLQTIVIQPRKRKRHRTADHSGVQSIDIIGYSLNRRARGYMGMMEYRNSARLHVIALEKNAMECYLEEKVQGTAMKHKVYGSLVSSVMLTETVDQLVNLTWRAVKLRHFEGEMRTTSKVHALIAIPYVKTELKIRFALCMKGLVMGEYDSEERKRWKEEKVLLMTSLRDIMISEGVSVACAKQRYALRFVRFMLEQI